MKATIVLLDQLYETVKQWASAEGTSIKSWMQDAIERKAFERRCIAHGQWMDANPNIREELLAQAENAAQEVGHLRRDGAA